jgi:hypothetical protein
VDHADLRRIAVGDDNISTGSNDLRLLLRNVLRLLSVPAASFQELCVPVQQLFFFFSLEDTSLCSS